MKVMLVFGTRPEAIKMAPLFNAMQKDKRFEPLVCVTAQHREMLDQVLGFFSIKPDYDLNIMKPGQNLYDITANVLHGMKPVLEENKPDWLLVHGDTTTTFSAALAAFYAGIPVGHVEAGLRTFDLKEPFPEEANRQLTGRLASLHFAPTEINRQNLINEGIKLNSIHVTGNTVIDALFHTISILNDRPVEFFSDSYGSAFSALLNGKSVILVTVHRRENFGDGIANICEALRSLAQLHPHEHFVFPVHHNPNIKLPVTQSLSNTKNIHLIEPLEYPAFVYLMNRSRLILSDSGGIQEEAPSLGKRVLVLRDQTERPEAISSGMVTVIGSNKENIIDAVNHALVVAEQEKVIDNPFGNGNAAKTILDIIYTGDNE